MKNSGLRPLVLLGLQSRSNQRRLSITAMRLILTCKVTWTYALSLLDLVDLELELVVFELDVERERVGVVHVLAGRMLLQDSDAATRKRLERTSQLLGLDPGPLLDLAVREGGLVLDIVEEEEHHRLEQTDAQVLGPEREASLEIERE